MGERTFRQIMERLEAIAATLEREDLELEEGLRLFEEGVGLVREARRRLAEASAKVERLVGSMEDLATEEFLLEGEEEGKGEEEPF